MVASIRYTSHKQQERISRHQLSERLDEFGWLPSPPAEDLGEDFIVHIYFQGRATGVTFHIQEKSVANLHERRKGNHLVYDFEVKDLKHWETFSLPVALVIWDVRLREGRWALIDTVIADLDQQRPKWRKNKSKARVYIPWKNTTDDAGLIRLKQAIGRHVYPLISKDRALELGVKLRYPKTKEGKAAYTAFERHLKEGDEVTIEGKFIEEIKFSEWWMRWFGEYDPNYARLHLGPPALPKTFTVCIDIISSGKTVSIPAIELKNVKDGTELVELSNYHQPSPLHLHFTIRDPNKYTTGNTITWKINHLGRHVHETRNILNFLQAITVGGTLTLTFLTLDNSTLTMRVLPQPKNSSSLYELQLIDQLCKIQDKVGQFIQIPIEGLTNKDIQSINELIAIIENGKTTKQVKEIIPGEFKDNALDLILDVHRQGKPGHFTISSDESYVELLGLEISTGRITQHITGKPELSATELETAIAKLSPGEYMAIKFVDVEIVEIFPNWFIREARRLSQLLVDRFGAEDVYLFGSLVWSDVYAPETDIDLAVSGLPTERYLEAVGYLEQESNFPVDLVELDKLPAHLRERILTEGELLNEREPVMATG